MSSRYVSGRTDLLLVFMLLSLTLFFICSCDVAHVYFFSTIMSVSFSSLLCIPYILLPALLCYVPLFLCSYNFLPDHVFLYIRRSYIGVYPHWDRLFLCCSHLSYAFQHRSFLRRLLPAGILYRPVACDTIPGWCYSLYFSSICLLLS